VDTIGSRFGVLPSALPDVRFPRIPFERTREMLPSSLHHRLPRRRGIADVARWSPTA
jgi:hypothetical protein